ncbi:hypothetical protein ACFQFS_03730 [Novosphingobium lubricantis]|jgi:hypothetical protein
MQGAEAEIAVFAKRLQKAENPDFGAFIVAVCRRHVKSCVGEQKYFETGKESHRF